MYWTGGELASRRVRALVVSATICAPTRAVTRTPVGSMVIGWPGPGILGSRVVVMVLSSVPGGGWFSRRSGGSAGDEVELVALDVGERGPPGAVAGEFAELGGAERNQAHGLALVVAGDQVRVEPVLDGLGLGDLVEGQSRPAAGFAGLHHGMVLIGPGGHLPAEGGGPERG